MEEKTVTGELCPFYVLAPFWCKGFLFFTRNVSPNSKKKRRQKMKKILSLILAVVMILGLVSCGAVVGEQGDVTFVIENRDGSYDVYKMYLEDVENRDKGALGVIESLNARENNPLPVDMSGTMMKSIGSLEPDASKGEYIFIYTSLEKDFGTGDFASTIEYEGQTLTMAGVGIESMSVEAGTVILFRIETW